MRNFPQSLSRRVKRPAAVVLVIVGSVLAVVCVIPLIVIAVAIASAGE